MAIPTPLQLAPIRVKPLTKEGFFGRSWADFHKNQAIALQGLSRAKADLPTGEAETLITLNETASGLKATTQKLPKGWLVGTEERQTLKNKTMFQPDLQDANITLQSQQMGTFTVGAGDTSTVVPSAAITKSSVIIFSPVSRDAAILVATANPFIDPANNVVGESFTMTIDDAMATGTEVFSYLIFSYGPSDVAGSV